MSSTIKVNNIQNLAGDDSGIDLSTNDQIILKTANTTAITVDSSQDTTVAGNIKKTGDLTLDVSGDITLDADGADIKLADGGTVYGELTNSSSYLVIKNPIQDQDIEIKGNDGGSEISAVRFDMSDGGRAVFNNGITIGGSGDVLMQTSSSLGNATLHVDAVGSTYVMVGRASSAGGFVLWQKDDGTTIGSIDHTSSATRYLTSSDYRLKENITYDFDATSRLKQLKPCRFNFIADPNTTIDGFIAHEVTAVPEAISGEKDAMTKEVLYVDGDEIPKGKKVGDVKTPSQIDPQGIDQSKLVPLLVKTIQELEARITALESE